MRKSDLQQSVELLSQGFHTWHRLQEQGVVRSATLNNALSDDQWQDKHPENFRLLHKGSHEPDSYKIGEGKHGTVYQKGRYAFKRTRVGLKREREDHFFRLRCAVKELAYFHAFQFPHLMRPIASQVVMTHGLIKNVIHQMDRARCTLLETIIHQEFATFQDIVFVFHQIALGLQHLHHHKVVHGDIKPANILLTSDYRVLITDFTISSHEGKGMTYPFGSLYWRAPECVLARDSTCQSDMWSFGMMLMDALYGCVYMEEVMKVDNNEDAWQALLAMLGEPPIEFIAQFVDAEHQKELWKKRKPPPRLDYKVNMTRSEWKTVHDLLKQLLVWMPSNRITSADLLKHPVFLHSVPPRGVTVQTMEDVVWRTASEKEHLRHLFQLRYQLHDPWLLEEMVLLTKRVSEKLRSIQATFHQDHVVELCAKVLLFLWRDDTFVNDPFFESELYHVLHLLDFRIFSWHVLQEEWRPDLLQLSAKEDALVLKSGDGKKNDWIVPVPTYSRV